MDSVPQDDIPRKQCTGVCKRMLPDTTDYFYYDRQHDRMFTRCKQCLAQQQRDHADEVNRYHREYRKANRERINERDKPSYKRYRQRHRERVLEGYRTYRLAHLEERRALGRKIEHEHRAQRREAARRRATINPEPVRISSRTRRARKREVGGTHTVEDINRQLQAQKNTCYWCHDKFEKRDGKYIYHADHIIPLSRGGSNAPDNLVIACPHCNLSKHNKLPHEWPQGNRLL